MEKDEILSKLASGQIGVDEAKTLLGEIEPERRGNLYCKVSPKGALSVYGLQRMPVTLYVEQWTRLLEFADQVREFIKQHDDQLKRKAR
jgi:hypothetical protein